MKWLLAGLGALMLIAVYSRVLYGVAYHNGAEDASCYAVMAGAGGSLPADYIPCPPERRAGA